VSDTATRDGSPARAQPAPAAPDLVPPPKLRRRPALAAAAVVAICLGALLAGWAWTATTNTQEVLVARHTIERGALIDAGDLARVRLSADPAVKPVLASEIEQVVGQHAALDIAEGGLLTAGSLSGAVVPADGNTVVGVALTAAQAPGLVLQTGDRVRLVTTPAQGEKVPAGVPEFSEAEVVAVHVSPETGQTVVDVLIPHAEAALLAARVATGNVTLVLDSRER
jgi:hypothetical protein